MKDKQMMTYYYIINKRIEEAGNGKGKGKS